MRVGASDLEITSSNSLGTTGSGITDYTEILQGTNSGALRLTNNITTSEEIYFYQRDTTDFPQIRNVSGSNTLATIQNDFPNVSGFCMVSSDGTAVGDLLTIQGDILRTSVAGNGLSELWLMGAGNGVVGGSITESGSNNLWTNVQKTGAGKWTLLGANNYTGTTVVDQGTLSLGSTGALVTTPLIHVKTGAILDVSGQPSFTVGASAVQSLKGDGSVTGNVTIAAGSAFAVDYAGSTIDSLSISGAFTISGATIDFNDIGGALTGGPHVIATYGSLVGTFGTTLDLPLGYILDYDYLGNQIALVASAHPGDFDSDGDVDGADFVAWQTNFPTASGATLAQGDADGDGDVDGADFVVWQTNFPFTPGPGASPVPEPIGFASCAIGVLGLALAGRRRARG
jgi:autotransporter-associated beta strand protein